MYRPELSNKRTEHYYSKGKDDDEEEKVEPEGDEEEGDDKEKVEFEEDEIEYDCNISDITVNHHPKRKGVYSIVEQYRNNLYEDDNTCIDTDSPWIVDGINLSDAYKKYTEFCFLKNKPQELNDQSILAISNIYLFSETLRTSITRYFGFNSHHHRIIDRLGIYDYYSTPSSFVYEWCAKCIICASGNWRELQKLTISFMNKALESDNDLDLIVANVLHRILPSLKIVGYVDQRGEGSFVHDVLAPLLDLIFTCDPNLNHFWANITLNKEYKDYKRFGVLFAQSSNSLITTFKGLFKKKRNFDSHTKKKSVSCRV